MARMKVKPYILGAAFLAAFNISSADERVELRQTPAPVQRAIEASGSSSAVKEVTKKTVDGRTVYDVEYERNNAINPRLRVAEDGTIIRANRSASDTSAAVSDEARATRDNVRDGARRTSDNVSDAVRDDARAVRKETSRAVRNAEGEMSAAATAMSTKLEDVPAAVRSTIQAQSQGRDIADIDRETHNGQTVYEVEFRQSGRNAQLHISEDGTVVKSENTAMTSTTGKRAKSLFMGTQLEDTPSAVQDTIRREVADRQIVDIDKEVRTGRTVYEVEVKDTQGKFQLHIAEDGTVVKDDRASKR